MSFRIERIKPSAIIIDGRVQRGLDLKRANTMAAEFEIAAFGVPTISRREDGSLHAVDGQHRVMAAGIAGHGERPFPMKVHEGLSLEEEARLFRLLNNTRKPLPVDLFKIAVVEKEPAALAMNRLVKNAGLTVANSGETSFRAVSALRDIYTYDPLAAERALQTLVRSWGCTSTSVQAALVSGTGRFFMRYADQPSMEKLISRLAKYPGGANAMIGAARGLARIRSVTVADAVADILVQEHNKTARQNQLPQWNSAR
jgi:hypothetical protein